MLGVNIDHVATLRNARGGTDPDPVLAAREVFEAGAGKIVCHLREDRRHIRDQDLANLISWGGLPLNLEMALTPEMEKISLEMVPHLVTLVPENRLERTTEGGLSLDEQTMRKIHDFHRKTSNKKIQMSLFLDPDMEMIRKGCELGVEQIELHTGSYAHAFIEGDASEELLLLREASGYIVSKGIRLALGHGLDCQNIPDALAIAGVEEVNIGHSIVARSIFIGLRAAILEIQKKLMDDES